MKNITKLLLTSALVAGVASAALADAPVITVGGKVDFRTAFVDQKSAYKASTATDSTTTNAKRSGRSKMATTTNIDVKAEGKNDAGLTYGAMIRLEDAQLNSLPLGNSDQSDAVRIRKSFIFFDSAMGRIELGNNDSASKTMKADASDIARASGGIDGDALDFVNDTVGYANIIEGVDYDDISSADTTNWYAPAKYLTTPNLVGDATTGTRKFNKVTYYTPEISGLKLGLSYSTDSESRGGLSGIKGKDFGTRIARSFEVGYNDIFTAGLSYNYLMDNVGIKVSATGQYGKAKKMLNGTTTRDQYHNLRAYNAGAVITYTNFSLAGSYGDNGKSGLTKESIDDNFFNKGSKYYTAGLSYVQGPVGLSVTNFSSKRMKNRFDMLSVGADYELAKGALAYVEGNFFKFTPEKTRTVNGKIGAPTTLATKNSGNVVLVGAKFAF